MAQKTGIEWTDHTFNVAWGCTKISPGCANCYADRDATRYGYGVFGPKNPRRIFGDAHWNAPLKWNADAEREGIRRRVFTSSMADVFEDHPTIDAERGKLFDLIARTPHLDWQVLTKRAERMAQLAPRQPLPNVWLGVSVETPEQLERVRYLIDTPAAVRFISYEPALAAVDFSPYLCGSRTLHMCLDVEGALRNRSFDGFTDNGRPLSRDEARAELQAMLARGEKLLPMGGCDDFDPERGCRGHRNPRIDWLIVGTESGPKRRPCEPVWVASAVEQTRAANIALFVKQVSIAGRVSKNPEEWPPEWRIREFPGGAR